MPTAPQNRRWFDAAEQGPKGGKLGDDGVWRKRNKKGKFVEVRQDPKDKLKRWYSLAETKSYYRAPTRYGWSLDRTLEHWNNVMISGAKQKAKSEAQLAQEAYAGPERRMVMVNGVYKLVVVGPPPVSQNIAEGNDGRAAGATGNGNGHRATAAPEGLWRRGAGASSASGNGRTIRYHSPDVRAMPASKLWPRNSGRHNMTAVDNRVSAA